MGSTQVTEEAFRVSAAARHALAALSSSSPMLAQAVRQKVMREMAEGYSELDPDSPEFVLHWATQILLQLQTLPAH